MHPSLAILTLLVALPLGACGDSVEAKAVRESTTRALADLKTYALAQKDELAAESKEALAALDTRIDEMGDQLGEAGSEAQERIVELRKSASEKLAQVEQATAENWERARLELIEALEALDSATGDE